MKLVKGLVTGMVMGALWAFWWVQTQQRNSKHVRKPEPLRIYANRTGSVRNGCTHSRNLTYEMRGEARI